MTWEIFYFLWGDSLFTPRPSNPNYIDPDDDELLALKRQYVLLFIDTQYQIRAASEKLVDRLREDLARELWTINQLLKYVAPEVSRRILIDRKVNDMDPDFSFRATVAPTNFE